MIRVHIYAVKKKSQHSRDADSRNRKGPIGKDRNRNLQAPNIFRHQNTVNQVVDSDMVCQSGPFHLLKVLVRPVSLQNLLEVGQEGGDGGEEPEHSFLVSSRKASPRVVGKV